MDLVNKIPGRSSDNSNVVGCQPKLSESIAVMLCNFVLLLLELCSPSVIAILVQNFHACECAYAMHLHVHVRY